MRTRDPILFRAMAALVALAVIAWVVFVVLLALPPENAAWFRLLWWDVTRGADPITAAAATGVVVTAAAAFVILARPASRRGWSLGQLALAIGGVAGFVVLVFVVAAPGYMAPTLTSL